MVKKITAIEAAKSLAQWITPIVACCGFVIGFYYRTEGRLQAIDDRSLLNRQIIEKLREDLDRRSSFGPDGFLDGGIRSGINSTIRFETKHLATHEELQRAIEHLYELNGQLRR